MTVPLRLRDVACAVLLAVGMSVEAAAMRIPAFARQYRTGCTTCHVAAPKLNALGEAFRLNGYRLPENAALIRKEAPVPLGEEPWEDLWPRAIYPGETPGTAPIAIRIQSGLEARRAPRSGPSFTLRMPEDIYIMAGASLGEGIGAFVVAEWDREDGVAVRQAKILFRSVVPRLPQGTLNLSVGLQNLYLLTTGDRQIDRIGIRAIGWQSFSWSQVPLQPAGGVPPVAGAAFALADAQPALVINGILGGRTFYSAGLAQGTTSSTTDGNNRKDLFYTVRHKWGGLRLDGAYDPGDGPPSRSYGQLLDHAVILEHFGYRGAVPLRPNRSSSVRATGLALRVLRGRTDAAVGVVVRTDDDPWDVGVEGTLRSTFARTEVQLYPWLIASLKVERQTVRDDAPVAAGAASDHALATPSVVMLVRQNIRVIAEGDLYARHEGSAAAGRRRPNRLAARLDVAF